MYLRKRTTFQKLCVFSLRMSLMCWYILETGQLWFSNRRWDLLTTQPEGDFCCNISEVKRHMKEEFDPAVSKKYCHQLYHKQTKPAQKWGFSVPFQKEKKIRCSTLKAVASGNTKQEFFRKICNNFIHQKFCQKDIQHKYKLCLKIKCKICQAVGLQARASTWLTLFQQEN